SEREADDFTAILAELNRVAEPGQTLFTGPGDLSRTNYADSFVYFLEPQLEPASRFTELNAGIADAAGSGLARELAAADYLILNHRWDSWDEDNASSEAGSTAANRIVSSRFQPIARSGDLRLYARR